jgi:hypothetical protein
MPQRYGLMVRDGAARLLTMRIKIGVRGAYSA